MSVELKFITFHPNTVEKLPEFKIIQLTVVATKPILGDFATANRVTFEHHFYQD